MACLAWVFIYLQTRGERWKKTKKKRRGWKEGGRGRGRNEGRKEGREGGRKGGEILTNVTLSTIKHFLSLVPVFSSKSMLLFV